MDGNISIQLHSCTFVCVFRSISFVRSRSDFYPISNIQILNRSEISLMLLPVIGKRLVIRTLVKFLNFLNNNPFYKSDLDVRNMLEYYKKGIYILICCQIGISTEQVLNKN